MGFIYFVIVFPFLVLTDGQTFKSVTRKTSETDAFMYTGDCFDVCAPNAYQTDSSCNCKCQVEYTYSVTEKRCMRTNPITDAIQISHGSGQSQSFVNTISFYYLTTSGYTMYDCTDSCRVSTGCTINKARSLYDNFRWERMWLPQETPDFYVENINNRQMLKLSKDSKRYRGMLLRINFDCKDLNDRSFNTYAMFSVDGTFTEKERPEDRIASGTKTTTSVTTISSTDKVAMTTTTTQSTDKSNSTGIVAGDNNGDGSNAAGTAVAVLFVILFLVAVAVGIYLYYKWRQDKVAFVIKFNENKVVQYVQIKKSRLKEKFFHERDDIYDTPSEIYTDTQSQISVDVLPDVVSVAEKQNSLQTQKSQEHKVGTFRGLYATIDKFIRGKSKSSKADRSFSAFPKELYHEPGVIFKIEKPKKPKRVNVKSIVFSKSKSVDEETHKKQEHKAKQNVQPRTRSASLPPIESNINTVYVRKPRPISLTFHDISNGSYSNATIAEQEFYMNTPVGSQQCLIYQNDDVTPDVNSNPIPSNPIPSSNIPSNTYNNIRKRSSLAIPVTGSLQTISEHLSYENEIESDNKLPEDYITMHPAHKTDAEEEPVSPPYANADNVHKEENEADGEGYEYPEHVLEIQEDESYLTPHPENEEESEPVYETPGYATCSDAVPSEMGENNLAYEYETPGGEDPDYILPPHLSPPGSFSENIFSNIRMSIFRDDSVTEKT